MGTVATNELPPMSVPWVESPAFEDELHMRSSHLTAEEKKLATDLNRDGYAVLSQAIPHELCDQVLNDVEPMFGSEYALRERRVPDAWRQGAESVRELALDRTIQESLRAVYGRQPIPFQTLNFKWGTEQGFHSDATHFTSLPDRFMCGVWVALEDVDEGNGPLAYYPRSHRVPQFATFEPGSSPVRYRRMEDFQLQMAERLGSKPMEFHAKKGDALVWSSTVLHGGRPILRKNSTRWSQVTHFYFENCIYFQPIYSDALIGEFKLMDIVDLNTLEPVPQRYDGFTIASELAGEGRSRISLLGEKGQEIAGSVLRSRRLEEELHRARAERDELRNSASFRLGNALINPAHRFLGSLKRRT